MNFRGKKVQEKFRRIVLQVLRAPNSRKFDEFGVCSVCGQKVKFKANLWMISKEQKRDWNSPDEFLEFCLRESLFCGHCGSSYRQRRIAKVLIDSSCPKLHSSLVECNLEQCFSKKSILLINSLGEYSFMQNLMETLGQLTLTCFEPERDFGLAIDGRVNADIMNLPFSDLAFDLVIHSDVLEHLVDPNLAMEESIRVLRDEGRVIFTIPFRDLNNSFCRFRFSGNFRVATHAEVFHGRGSGILALLPKDPSFVEIHTYGRDFIKYLNLDPSKVEVISDTEKSWISGSDSVVITVK